MEKVEIERVLEIEKRGNMRRKVKWYKKILDEMFL